MSELRREMKTIAQRDWQQRHLNGPTADRKRLNMLVDLETMARLKRMSSYYGLTQRQMLQAVVHWVDEDVQREIEPHRVGDYHQHRLRRNP